jgi:prepilin-type processing-associated H-X9-DG protein
MYRESYREFPQQALISVDPLTGKGQAFGLMTTDTHRILARFLKTGFKNSPALSDIRAGELFYCPAVGDDDRVGDVPGQDQVDPNAPAYLHVTYAYLGRLNMALNNPAECHTNWGDPSNCDPKRDIPPKRRLYVTKDPDARRILMSDMLMYWGGKDRWRINHGPWYQPRRDNERVPLEGSNLAYGDGHVEWQPVYRMPRGFSEGTHPLTALDFRRTANLVRDQDMWWW